MFIASLLIAFLIGCVITYLLAHYILPRRAQINAEQLNIQNNKLEIELRELQNKLLVLTAQLAKSQSEKEGLSQQIINDGTKWESIQEKNRLEFETIVSRLSQQSSDYLKGSNEQNMKALLDPLKERINRFEEKIDKSAVDRNSLKEEIKRLAELNIRISTEATNLTKALKGDNKSQGNWGELILERVLERSGLENGVEYDTQYSASNDDGQKLRPDVIIHLPENKHIVIDSKVSLVHYEQYCSSDNDSEKSVYIKQHIQSIKTHITQLSQKSYAHLFGIDTPEFVLLFMPIEAAFSTSLQHDNDLFTFAWDKKIVIVSPTTLLATLRTISSVWKQEKQNRNALEIAKQSGLLYDKLYGFINDMEGIGKSIDKSRENYDKAMNKLKFGQGNMLDKAEKIKELGAKTKH